MPQQESAGPSLGEITHRLFTEFDARVALPEILAAVRHAYDDLAGTPPGALPELIERAARQRQAETRDHRPGNGEDAT